MNDDLPSASNAPGRAASGARLHPMEWAVDSQAVDEIWRETQRKVRHRRRRRFQVMAGTVAAACAVAIMLRTGVVNEPKHVRVAHESVASAPVTVVEPQRRVLADGSIVELKADAEFRVEFEETVRRVTLIRGEAYFQVAKDAGRPFVVQAGDVAVRAVGTAFLVQLEARQVDVLVTEGRVAVESGSAENKAQAGSRMVAEGSDVVPIIGAGRRVVVTRDGLPHASSPVVEEVSVADIDARLAWRAPRLDLTRTPLAEALEAINRHSRVKVVLADPELGDLRLSGILRADNLETLLRLIEVDHGVKAEWRGTSEVVLRRGR